MQTLAQLVSDFWYAVSHTIGHMVISNKFILWAIILMIGIWVAGIIYNENRSNYQN